MKRESSPSPVGVVQPNWWPRLLGFNALLGPPIGAFALVAYAVISDIVAHGWDVAASLLETVLGAALKMIGVMPAAYVLGICPAIANAAIMSLVLGITTNAFIASPISAVVGFVSSALFALILLVVLGWRFTPDQVWLLTGLFGLLGVVPGAFCTLLVLRRRPQIAVRKKASV